MATHTESQVKELQQSALEHLWVYLREPSEMAEKGEPPTDKPLKVNGDLTDATRYLVHSQEKRLEVRP